MQARFVRISLHLAAVMSLLFLAADWPQFRGPQGAGVSQEEGLPVEWDGARGIEWKTELPGFGASSPVVRGDRVYLTCYSGYGLDEEDPGDASELTRHIVCCDLASGKQIWSVDFPSEGSEHPYEGYLALHGYASSTPVIDGETIYAFFGRDGVLAVTLEGKTKWQTSVGTTTHHWGSGTSPVLYENVLIVNASVESGSICGLDKQTGRELWRAAGIRESWSTPALVPVSGGAVELVVSAQSEVLGLDPKSGERLWRCDGIRAYVCPSVIAHDGVAFVIGSGRDAIAVKAGGRGDVSETHRLWEARKGSNVSSPVYHQGHLYWVNGKSGRAYCADAETGEIVYEERLSPSPRRFIYASPVVADGKIFFVSRENGTYVLAAQPEFALVTHNEPLDDSIFDGSPAVVDGKLILRSNKYLYCLRQ